MFEYSGLFDVDVNQLQKKVEKLNKKARKIGCPEMELVIDNEYQKTFHHDADGHRYLQPRVYNMYDVTIHGETPSYDGWYFVGVITGYPNGQNVIAKSPFLDKDIDITEFRERENFCDHCKTKRYRKYTYLIANQQDEVWQVGSTCIKDFLGHSAPSFGFMAKTMDDLDEDPMEWDNRPNPIPFKSIREFLALSCDVIKDHGFTSRKVSWEYGTIATIDRIHELENILDDPKMLRMHPELLNYKISDESYKKADEVIEWGKSLKDRDNLNDYLYNLSVMFDNDIVDYRSEAFIVSAVNTYNNEMGENIQKKKKFNPKNSEYFGEAKKRYELELTLTKILEFESQFGKVRFHIFYDGNENQFVWYANNTEIEIKKDDRPVEIGDKIKVKATVKTHKLYNDIKQTVLNRVTGMEFIEKKEE